MPVLGRQVQQPVQGLRDRGGGDFDVLRVADRQRERAAAFGDLQRVGLGRGDRQRDPVFQVRSGRGAAIGLFHRQHLDAFQQRDRGLGDSRLVVRPGAEHDVHVRAGSVKAAQRAGALDRNRHGPQPGRQLFRDLRPRAIRIKELRLEGVALLQGRLQNAADDLVRVRHVLLRQLAFFPPFLNLLRHQPQRGDVAGHDLFARLDVHTGQRHELGLRPGHRRRGGLLGLQVLADTIGAHKAEQDGKNSNDDCSRRYARHNRFLPADRDDKPTEGGISAHTIPLYFANSLRLACPRKSLQTICPAPAAFCAKTEKKPDQLFRANTLVGQQRSRPQV